MDAQTMKENAPSTHLNIESESPSELDIIAKLGDRNLRLKDDVFLCPQLDNSNLYVVADESGKHFFYCDTDTFHLMQSLDGKLSLNQVIEKLKIEQHDFRQLEFTLAKFIRYGLLLGFDSSVDKPQWWSLFKQPIAMKFPLFNPDSFLDSLYGLTHFIFGRYFIFLFLVLSVFSLFQLPLHWESIDVQWQSRFFDPVNGVLLALAYIFLKSIHEIGHGLAVKKFGGTVRECGIFMLVFLPLPYVDTSASYAFSRRKERVIVGAAGMWVELTVAMMAFIAWQNSEPGYGADFLFNLVFVGSFSTLIFNLNPLMRFDGYYILSDYLGVFNLNSRSRDVLGSVIQRFLFRLDVSVEEDLPKLTKTSLMIYAACAAPYRVFIGLVIAVYLSGKFFVFGTALALWLLVQTLVFPIVRHTLAMYRVAQKANKTKRFLMVIGLSVVTVFSIFFIKEFRFSDSQVAMVIKPENQKVTALESGSVVSVNYQSGEQVKKGDLLAQLKNPELLLQLKVAQGLLDEYKSQHRLVGLNNISTAQSWREKMTIQQKEVELLSQRLAELSLLAPATGEFVLSRERDLLGRYVERGEVLARIYKPEEVKLLAVVSEDQVRQLSSGVDSVEVRFNTNPSQTYKGAILRIEPAAKSELPSRFMGSSLGGAIPVDSRDQTGLTSMSPFFLVEVLVEAGPDRYMPAMGTVRFVYKKMTLSDYILADTYYKFIQSLH